MGLSLGNPPGFPRDQPTTLFKLGGGGQPKPSMPTELLTPLILSLIAMSIFYAFLMLYRLRVERESEALAEQLASR